MAAKRSKPLERANEGEASVPSKLASEIQTQILAAASVLFLSHGLGGLSVRAIAKRAEVSTFAIYTHFNGKTGVLDALYRQGFQGVTEAMVIDGAENALGPQAIVLEASRNYLRFATEHSAHYRLIFGGAGESYEPSTTAKLAGRDAFEALIVLTAKLLPDEASYQDRRQNALEIWAIVHGFVCFQDHAVTQMIPDFDWEAAALAGVARHIKALKG